MKNMNSNAILLVDDEEDVREVLGITLKDKGYDVLMAGNGEEALDVFRIHRPRIVITDIKMPGMDGIDLLRQIKGEVPETEVILITGHGELKLAIQNLQSDATDFITKPIRDELLEIALKRAHDRIDMRDRLRECAIDRAVSDVVMKGLIQEDVMMIGASYEIIDINKNMLKKLGLEREQVIGKNCYEITHHRREPCSGKNHPCPLIETIKSGKPSQATHVHQDKDKRELHFSISCYPIHEDDRVIGVLEISRDITKEIAMQRTLMQQEKLASIGQLAAGVAHEINNPLTTILTTAMLTQEDMTPENPDYQEMQTIVEETLRCRKIVTGLLDFARQSKPAKEENNINDIVKASAALVRKQAAFNEIEVSLKISDDLPLIPLDKDQIQQSLINLALNAIEATESGGRIQFTTSWAPGRKAIEISITDTGKGIARQDLNKIFDPFYTTKENGTGLGMAITHGFILQHGGTINVRSRIGKGTTFTIRLPLDSGDSDDA